MMLSKKKCEIESCKGFAWKGGRCKQHLPPTPLKKQGNLIKKFSEKGLARKKEKTQRTKELHEWFLSVFDKRKDKNGYVYCYETNKAMHESVYRMNSCIYSHCFPKSQYPQYAKEEWNILLVLPEIHAQWETNREKTPKMLEYFKKIQNFIQDVY